MFKILVVGAFAEKYIKRCLNSITIQECGDWKAQVVLDPIAGDNSYDIACEFKSEKLGVFKNETRSYALANLLKAVSMLNCSDEDILLFVDADDWLMHRKVLDILKTYYDTNPDLLVTYGSWISYPNPLTITNCYAYSRSDFEKGIRKVNWRASHLRTMKYKVWKNIKDNDLRGPDGEYYRVTWDLAFMWPSIEMAGFERIKFIPELLYCYNEETPHNDKKEHLKEQMAMTDYIAARSPYDYRESFSD